MASPSDLGWGRPATLTAAQMVRGDVGLGTTVTLRNDDVVVVMREAVRRLVAAGFRPNDARDDGGLNARLKRWAEAAKLNKATASMDAWSDHAWGTALDVDWSQNAYHDQRPANWRQLLTLPANTGAIVAPLGLEWGGDWTTPWDPMHLQVAVSPAALRTIADRIRAGASPTPEDDDMQIDELYKARDEDGRNWLDFQNFVTDDLAQLHQDIGYRDRYFAALQASVETLAAAVAGQHGTSSDELVKAVQDAIAAAVVKVDVSVTGPGK